MEEQIIACVLHFITNTNQAMMTSSNGSLCALAAAGPLWGLRWSLVNSPHKGTVMRTFMFRWCGSTLADNQTIEWPVVWDYMTSMWRHRDAISISLCPFHHHVHLHIGWYTCFLFLKIINFTPHALHHSNRIHWRFFVNRDLNKNSRHFIVSQIFSRITSFVFLFDITEVCPLDNR